MFWIKSAGASNTNAHGASNINGLKNQMLQTIHPNAYPIGNKRYHSNNAMKMWDKSSIIGAQRRWCVYSRLSFVVKDIDFTITLWQYQMQSICSSSHNDGAPGLTIRDVDIWIITSDYMELSLIRTRVSDRFSGTRVGVLPTHEIGENVSLVQGRLEEK